MKPKIQILTAALILGYSVFMLHAQPRGNKPPMLPDSSHMIQRVDEMTEVLSLSKQQKSDILNLHFEHFEKVKQLLDAEKERHEAVQAKHDSLRDAFEDEILELLTDKQKMEFESFLKTHQPPRHAHPGDHSPHQMNH